MSKKRSNKSDNTELDNPTTPTHGVNELLVKVIKGHHKRGFDLDRIAAITMLPKAKVQEVIDSL